MAEIHLCVFLLTCFLLGVDEVGAGSYCMGSSRTSYRIEYCNYGCCGNTGNEYCCSYSIGMIIGGVIAAIALLCVFVALVCCFIKKKGHAGRVVRPMARHQGRHPNVTTVQQGGPYGPPQPYNWQQQPGGGHPGNAYGNGKGSVFGPPPPPYGQQHPPPPYGGPQPPAYGQPLLSAYGPQTHGYGPQNPGYAPGPQNGGYETLPSAFNYIPPSADPNHRPQN